MKWNHLLTIIISVLWLFSLGQSNAQILFHADFEDTKGPNNIDDWERTTPKALQFEVKDGKLLQTANEVVNTTKTLIPIDGSRWTDYTVAVDLWTRDNDILGLVFRYTDEDNYYSFQIGGSDFGNTWHLNSLSADDQKDWANPAWSNQDILLEGNLAAPLDQAGGTGYTMAVTISGAKIEVFFGSQVNLLDEEMPPKLGEVTDKSFDKGTTGLYIATNPSDFDNFIVLGPAGLAVTLTGKLATTWAHIKRK